MYNKPLLAVHHGQSDSKIKEYIFMKLNKICAASAVLALAVALTACGGSASTAASSTASSAAASSVAASSEAASSEAAESAEYTVYNTTGSTVSELYLYEAGSEDKGENLAGEAGLADGENVVITRDVEADKQDDMTYVLEFTTEDGSTQSFETLHYEITPISLKSVDAAAGATPIAFAAPEQ